MSVRQISRKEVESMDYGQALADHLFVKCGFFVLNNELMARSPQTEDMVWLLPLSEPTPDGCGSLVFRQMAEDNDWPEGTPDELMVWGKVINDPDFAQEQVKVRLAEMLGFSFEFLGIHDTEEGPAAVFQVQDTEVDEAKLQQAFLDHQGEIAQLAHSHVDPHVPGQVNGVAFGSNTNIITDEVHLGVFFVFQPVQRSPIDAMLARMMRQMREQDILN